MPKPRVHQFDPADGNPRDFVRINADGTEVEYSAGSGDASNPDRRLGLNLTKYDVVIPKGSSGDFDADLAEGPTIIVDPKSGKLAMTYVGYKTVSGTQEGSIGLAYSTDGFAWAKQGQILAKSGVSGQPDVAGCSGPLLLWDDAGDQYVLYYIGLTAGGYEGGTKTICYATASSLTGPWTRHGSVITPWGTGWRGDAVWHPSIVERDGTWYMFFNATSSGTHEAIGYATAPAITGPWTVDDVNSPIVDTTTSAWDSQKVGDPSVRRVGDAWFMDYYGYNGSHAQDGVAVTPDSSFPLGWSKYTGNPVLTVGSTYDAQHAHKPFTMYLGDVLFHYYTAVAADDTRQIALATEGNTAAGVPTSRQIATGTGLTGGGDLSADRALAIDLPAELERIQDAVAAMLVEGSNITLTYDDTAGTVTVAAAGGAGAALVPVTTLDSSGNLTFVTTDDGSLVTVEV